MTSTKIFKSAITGNRCVEVICACNHKITSVKTQQCAVLQNSIMQTVRKGYGFLN